MSDGKREYKMKRRAEQEAQTRQRITESAVELHGTLGPARTSMSAVAERAGVRRSTLYRHFPDDEALLGACSAHWAERNPPPDVEAWARVADPDERLALALEELYAFYGRNAEMLDRLLRDMPVVPKVAELMAPFGELLGAATEVLMRGRGLRGNAARRTRAALGHVLAFRSWQDLTEAQGLDEEAAVALSARFVAAAR